MDEREEDRKTIQTIKIKGRNKKKEIVKRVRVKFRPNVKYMDLRTKDIYEKNPMGGDYTKIPDTTTLDDTDDGR